MSSSSGTTSSAGTPPSVAGDTMMPRKGQSRVGLYAAIAVVVVVVVVLAGGYAAGWFKSSSTTNTGTCNVPSGQTIDGPVRPWSPR